MSDAASLVITRIVVGILLAAAASLLVLVTVRRIRRGEPSAWAVVVTVLALLVGSVPLPGAEVITGTVWFLVYPLLLAIYPDGRFVPRWSAVPALLWLPLTLVYVLTGAGISDQWWWAPVILITWSVLIGCQVFRYRRRASTREREQVRWALLGVLIEVSGFMALQTVTGGIAADGGASEALANLMGWPIPVALAIGIAASGIVKVDAILYVVVVVVLGGWTLAGTFAGGLALTRSAGVEGDPAVWWAASALAIMVLPVLGAARCAAGWLVHGVRPSPEAAARRLQERLDALSPAEDIADAVETEVRAAIGSQEVRVAPADETGGFPIGYQSEVLAQLLVSPRPAETALTTRDRQVAEALAARAAPALHGARALAELAEARAALVLARAEERKRLRRDLHDDLAPTLAGLGLGLSAIRELAPDELRPLVDEVQHGVREAIAQTRNLAHGLRPAILDHRGVADAVRERARLLEASGIEVELTTRLPGAGVLPAAIEVAVLLIAQEAITNVARHACAGHCDIAIWAADGILELSVEDDGVGIGVSGGGLGLGSMRERALELGGRTVIANRPQGGTRLLVRLPYEVMS